MAFLYISVQYYELLQLTTVGIVFQRCGGNSKRDEANWIKPRPFAKMAFGRWWRFSIPRRSKACARLNSLSDRKLLAAVLTRTLTAWKAFVIPGYEATSYLVCTIIIFNRHIYCKYDVFSQDVKLLLWVDCFHWPATGNWWIFKKKLKGLQRISGNY